jgi:hypothetical protein
VRGEKCDEGQDLRATHKSADTADANSAADADAAEEHETDFDVQDDDPHEHDDVHGLPFYYMSKRYTLLAVVVRAEQEHLGRNPQSEQVP